MAKQTFTTGQVLTAAQMTSLQQTAMGGGDATAKTASYVLVAADAGTTVAMNAAGATTITVNSGLFAAGDTVFIQNRGAGVCTVTAGTATVACAGSLALPQNDAGVLYFTSSSAAVFYDWIQVGATSPLTTKGDLYTYSTSDTRLPVGTDTYTLVADSSTSTGLKWAAPAGGGKVLQVVSGQITTDTTISSTSLTDTSITLNITPTLNTSKVLVIISFNVRVSRNTDNAYGAFKIFRDATGIWDATLNDVSLGISVGGGTSVETYSQHSVTYLDSPASTSSLTYKMQAKAQSTANSGQVRFQTSGNPSSITLLEIGA